MLKVALDAFFGNLPVSLLCGQVIAQGGEQLHVCYSGFRKRIAYTVLPPERRPNLLRFWRVLIVSRDNLIPD